MIKELALGLLCSTLYLKQVEANPHPYSHPIKNKGHCDVHVFGSGGDLKAPIVKENGTLCSKFPSLLVRDLSHSAGFEKQPLYQKGIEAFRHYLEEHAGFSQIGIFDPYRCGTNVVKGALILFYPEEEGVPSLDVYLSYNQETIRKGQVPLNLLEQYVSMHGKKEEDDITKKLAKIIPPMCKPEPEPQIPTVDLR